MGLDGKNKRLLLIVENLPVPFDPRVWNEAIALKEVGYSVTVICPKGRGYQRGSEIIDGINILRHPIPPEGNRSIDYLKEYAIAFLWEFGIAFKVFLGKGFDVIHAANPPDNLFLIGLVFKLFRKKFVYDHHDINPELYLAKFGRKGLIFKILLLFEKLSFMTADISIATNRSYRQIAIVRGGMPPDRVFVVRNGPELKKWNPVFPIEQLKYGKQFMVGYVGVISKQEGIDGLLRMVKYIREQRCRNDLRFVIVGTGPDLEDLKSYSEELGVQDIVEFTGRISDQELIEILSTCDVCVNPDVASEMNNNSTMNKVMEYMALRKPIVQYDLKEGRYSAQDASLYAKINDEVDFAAKILYLLDHPVKRRRMGDFGRKRVEDKLAWKYSKKDLIEAYKKLFKD